MMILKNASVQVLGVLCAILLSHIANAQISQKSDLFKVLRAKDSLMFDVGFNQCNLTQMEALLPEVFEFYHDKNGITRTKTAFIKTIKENLCSSGQNTTQRVLEEGSLEVFPLYDQGELYGAIQTGRHSFGSTIAKFTNIWLLENDEWMPSRILSYDHQMMKPLAITDVTFVKLSSDEMLRYLGDYRFSPDFTLSIVNEKEKLYGDAQGQKVEIKPYGNHRFLDESQTMKLTFTSDASGLITGLMMQGPNGEMTAKKVN